MTNVGIISMAYRVPDLVRTNDDPIFDWLKAHNPEGTKLFVGYDERRVLARDESALDILVPAAEEAMANAEVDPTEIDLIIGCVSPNTYLVPSDLFDLTLRLRLRDTTMTIPLGNDFSNFNGAVVLADAMLRSGRARTVLLAIGGGWSRVMDYHTPQAVSVGDGAAAAVIGFALPGTIPQWTLIDSEVIAQEVNFGQMFLLGDRRTSNPHAASADDPNPLGEDWTGPYFHISNEGLKNFKAFGGNTAPLAALRVMQRQCLAATDVTFTGHQVSQVFLDLWRDVLQVRPEQLFHTLPRFGNMTVANIPVNLCLMQEQQEARTSYIIALSLAPDMHAHALLLRLAR